MAAQMAVPDQARNASVVSATNQNLASEDDAADLGTRAPPKSTRQMADYENSEARVQAGVASQLYHD